MSFDIIAPWYRTLETIAFGNALQRARVACLNEIEAPKRALIVGEGNGRFLSEFLRRHRRVEIDCIDASERMLQLARQRIGDEPNRVRFLQREILSWSPPPGQYDLIVTHFFLDCFPEEQLGAIIPKLADAATAEATWLVADFSFPAEGFARIRARIWLSAMYRFFRAVAGIEARQLIDPSPFLRAAGFAIERQNFFWHGILKSEAWRRAAN